MTNTRAQTTRGRSPLLVALPHGMGVSGVTLWAVRLVNGLAARGRACALLVHPEAPGVARLDLALHPGVELVRLEGTRPLEQCAGDLSPYLPHYRAAVGRLADRGGTRVVISPNLLGDCYGLAAAAAAETDARVMGVQHNDIEYDGRVLEHYETAIARFIPVSEAIASKLRARLPGRATHITHVPHGVEAPERPPVRGYLGMGGHGRPVRLVYTGRIEHQQKRALALAYLSDELTRRCITHQITAIGDGPAAAEFDAMIASRPSVRRLPPGGPAEVTAALDAGDALVLPSRFEGLSLSMLEAMARGCVPIVARTDSGAPQVIEDGCDGLIADVAPEADERAAGAAVAEAVVRFVRSDPALLASEAWRTVRRRFSLETQLDRYELLIAAAAAHARPEWPAGRPFGFTAPGAGGSVPPDGEERLRRLLAALTGRRVVIHGTGAHTRQLESVILASPAAIVAFADDDRLKHGTMLWERPVVAPADAATTGATDVVISTWMHQDAVWERRSVYERQGLPIHRIYAPDPVPSA